jgi:triosephosphate isomerase
MFLFGTNTKLQHTPSESARFVAEVMADLKQAPLPAPVQLWYCPPATSFTTVAQSCQEHAIWLGAQNCHWDDSGAHTGELSPRVLRAAGAELVMLGHAERRTLSGESDVMIHQKVRAALRNGLRPMLCIGENAAEKAAGRGDARLREQLCSALDSASDFSGMLVLYEPVWSVGERGSAAAPNEVAHAFALIRKTLAELQPASAASVRLLYGGSVSRHNAHVYAALSGCDGVGVGRHAWTAPDFCQVLRAAMVGRES